MKFEDTVYAFLKELERFNYTLSCLDHIWKILFIDVNGRWNFILVNKYRQTFYISHIDGNSCALEVVPKKSVTPMESFSFSSGETGRDDPARVWGPLITSARDWLRTVEKNWVRSNAIVQKQYPLNRRFGIVPNALIRESLADIYRIDKELGRAKSNSFIRLVEDGYFHHERNTTVEAMTATKYFDYCRIAYIAAKRKDDHVDERLCGREMYARYADGRHEGLLDIDANSPQEFAGWIDGTHPKKSSGGHPWEIKRGGNTTHINLSVYRPFAIKTGGFKIELNGAAINRMVETVRMFLAIHDASLPISIADPEGVRRRLLGQDNIGIVPCYDSLHRANQHFREDHLVYDVLYYDDLGRYKRRITPFITWEPLPVLKVRSL